MYTDTNEKVFLVKFENQQAGQQNDQLVENLVQRTNKEAVKTEGMEKSRKGGGMQICK